MLPPTRVLGRVLKDRQHFVMHRPGGSNPYDPGEHDNRSSSEAFGKSVVGHELSSGVST